MALIKEPYGLVYNTDGSVCTTVRPDQIPFPGVRSFAVETATTNLLSSDSASFENSVGNWQAVRNTIITISTDYSYFGEKSLKVENTNGNTDASTGSFLMYFVRGHMTDDYNYYTISMYIYSPTTIIVKLSNLNYIASNGDISLTEFTIPGGQWKRIWATIYYENPTAAPYHLRMTVRADYAGQSFYIDGVQFEAKSFPTSFVVGSRQTGRLEISVKDLMFDIANDDWVISYWKYPVATYNDTQNDFNLCSLGRYTTDNTKGYIYFGKGYNMNKYRLFVVLNDATGVVINSNNTFNPTDYFYHWHYEVVKKSGKVLSYYVDGVKQCEVTIPANKEIQTPFDVGLSLGGFSGSSPNNALIAAPYYGYNSATWTDDYIREVYEAKIPFSVQSQLSIY